MDIRSFRSVKSVSVASVLFLALSASVGCSSGSGDSDDGEEGTGGAPSATGGAPSGTGGAPAATGGAPAATSVCDGKSYPAEVGIIVSGDQQEVDDSIWDAYQSSPDVDTAATGTDGEIVEDGNTAGSYHYEGAGWATYGAGVNVGLMGCQDLTGITGVKFWAKGTTKMTEGQTKPADDMPENVLNFRVITPGAHGVILDANGTNVGGDCVVAKGGCFMPPQVDIELTSEWKQYTIPFSELKVPAGAAPGSALDPAAPIAMLVGWHSSNGDFDIYLDDVEFYTE